MIHLQYQEFIISLKDELLPIFSSVGLYILESWMQRIKNKKKEKKEKIQAIQIAIDYINLYISEVLNNLFIL